MKAANDLNFKEHISAILVVHKTKVMWATGKAEEVDSVFA